MEEPYETLREDGTMSSLVDEFGEVDIETEDPGDGFGRLVVSIVRQSISTEAADSVLEDLKGEVDAITPASILGLPEERLAATGVGETKVEYLRSAARAFSEGDYSRATLDDLSDDEVRGRLTEIRGVGRWTADMYLIFVLGREDVLPLGDLAVRRGMESLYGVETRDEMREVAEAWRPYRTYGTIYVWKWYEA